MNAGQLEGSSSDQSSLTSNSSNTLVEAREADFGTANSTTSSSLDDHLRSSSSDAFSDRTDLSGVGPDVPTLDSRMTYSELNSSGKMAGHSDIRDQRKIDHLYETANLHRRIDDFEKAIGYYSEIIELDQRFAAANYERGLCYVELSKDQLALEKSFSNALRLGLEDFAKAISIEPRYWSVFREEPFYIGLGKRQLAIDSYIKRKTDSYAGLPETDLDFVELQTDDQASVSKFENGEDSIEKVSGRSVTKESFINPSEDEEDKTAAFSLITFRKDEASSTVNSKAETLYKRGKMNQELGEQNNALDDYSAAITISPGFAPALYDRALCYVSLGKDELALEDFSNAIALEPGYWSSLRKEQFYLDLGVRRVDVEKYITSRCSAYDNALDDLKPEDVEAPYDVFGVEQDERPTIPRGIFSWATGLTRVFRKTSR